jgi:hypothetical protein
MSVESGHRAVPPQDQSNFTSSSETLFKTADAADVACIYTQNATMLMLEYVTDELLLSAMCPLI